MCFFKSNRCCNGNADQCYVKQHYDRVYKIQRCAEILVYGDGADVMVGAPKARHGAVWVPKASQVDLVVLFPCYSKVPA